MGLGLKIKYHILKSLASNAYCLIRIVNNCIVKLGSCLIIYCSVTFEMVQWAQDQARQVA